MLFWKILPVLMTAVLSAPALWAEDKPVALPEVPEDLLEDDHVREEFGVNPFTAPSIRQLFKDLDSLGEIPYERLSRKIPAVPPRHRAVVAVSLGILISDGLVSVQCEKQGDLEPIGRALLDHAKLLGAGDRMQRHTKSLVEHSLDGDWSELKDELAATQKDVEAELVQLRDVDLAHLISLGGWLRAFQIGCESVEDPFQAEKAATLPRTDIADYFVAMLETMDMEILREERIMRLREGLVALRASFELPEGQEAGPETVAAWKKAAGDLLELLTTNGES